MRRPCDGKRARFESSCCPEFGSIIKQGLCYKFMWLGHHNNQSGCVISNMCFCGQLSDKDNSN